MSKHCAEVPVPKVYGYSSGLHSERNALPFIAEQYINAPPLSDVWPTYAEPEKEVVGRRVAELIVRLGEIRFDRLGGMAPDGTLAPTVEGAKLATSPRKEPFVLCHNDLQARNILMDGTEMAGVIDWEFAGAYPLSALNSDGFEALEIVDGASQEECLAWTSRISTLVVEIARERAWAERDVRLLESGGDPELQAVRVEMMPV
ncbi:hypothetical protein EJ03DRAFT_4582 [Teratosphaeria nubilosa]|uniref:Aminoglycoside phosphotransferase domain-containing protein n=1 Tax=Teratosphaeria nubilosa TaxID=161662 RepID=A0A6G1LQ81_9PEZI|nr:hypothetical protein EJ03DRAFT_4582 [Teratosphaeria nubilosa]